MNLAEEFALLAYGDDGTPADRRHRTWTTAWAAPCCWSWRSPGRVDVEDKRVVVLDGTPTGDPLVDQALGRIAADGKPRKPGHWVKKFAKDTRTLVLDRLVERGRADRGRRTRCCWVFPRTRYPAAQGVEPVPETEARQRMIGGGLGIGPVEPRTAALCALVAATNLDRKVFARPGPRAGQGPAQGDRRGRLGGHGGPEDDRGDPGRPVDCVAASSAARPTGEPPSRRRSASGAPA